MVSISNSSRNKRNNDLGAATLPLLYFCLGAIFMSLFGRLSTMMNISSGKSFRNELDPRVVESSSSTFQQQGIISSMNLPNPIDNPGDEADGGLPETTAQRQYQHLTDELQKRNSDLAGLRGKLGQKEEQLLDQAEKISKYETVVDELYKSRKRYGLSEEHLEALNITLSRVQGKVDQVRSILRGGGSTNTNDNDNDNDRDNDNEDHDGDSHDGAR